MKRWIIVGCWIGWGLASGLAEAKSAEEAEYERLLSEMTKFSKTQSWVGVNKRFAEMEKLGLEIGVNESPLMDCITYISKLLSCKSSA